MHASQIVDDQSLNSQCVDVRATHLIVIHLFVYLSHCSISCCPKRKGFFCSCISPLVKSERTPSMM